jgi:hypothetical protein
MLAARAGIIAGERLPLEQVPVNPHRLGLSEFQLLPFSPHLPRRR